MSQTRSGTTFGGPENPSLSSDNQIISKSDEVWFEDGNIVLQTSMKRYRVHKGVLAAHSSVFKDMISLPQPLEGIEVFEECPIVHLTDLTEDWDEFLPLLYGMRSIRGQIDLQLMVAMLRLGQKYGCDRFKAQALEQFQRVFPCKFDIYRGILKSETAEDCLLEEFAFNCELYLVDVALDLGIQSVIPLAFFNCLNSCTTSEIFEGSYNAGPGRSGILRPQTRKILLEARERIKEAISIAIYPWWKQAETSAQCITKEICTDAIQKEAMRLIGVPDVQEVFKPKIKISSIKALCEHCKSHGESTSEAAQREIFDALPVLFDLPKWADLKDFQT